MAHISPAEELFRKTVSLAAGLEDSREALAGMAPPPQGNKDAEGIWKIFQAAALGEEPAFTAGEATLAESFSTARQSFTAYYGRNSARAEELLQRLSNAADTEEAAAAAASAWAPELEMTEEETLRRWRLISVEPNPRPIKPAEVMLQLNALYTLPEEGAEPPQSLTDAWITISADPGDPVADYDHPVPLFEREAHELIDCLDELDNDLSFEKEQKVLPPGHRVPVLVSISVTHPSIDRLADEWVHGIIKEKNYRHIDTLILTEHAARSLCSDLFGTDIPLFTVLGAYGAHFNALKYTQLLLEKPRGIRAGFKLDTDEGIRSRDLFEATGKTWFETLCHPYWGGSARDWKGRPVVLGINEGEYINSTDISTLGYKGSLRCPDVKTPASHAGPDLFFAKAFAHGRATALYNNFHSIEDFISHPVVKGGGYGITNDALRRAIPFTLSIVGRAEDQQFYFSGLSRGIRGIFHPDLRIAHYKDRVSRSEGKTAATRFAGDMFRLVLFGHLAETLGVKEDIDPMPGIFASALAPAQSFFHTLTRAYLYAVEGRLEDSRYLLGEVLERLWVLRRDIADGTTDRLLQAEEAGWKDFIRRASAPASDKIESALERISAGPYSQSL